MTDLSGPLPTTGTAVDSLDSDRIDHSKFAWPLTDIERFEPVVPARGAQGFWDWHA